VSVELSVELSVESLTEESESESGDGGDAFPGLPHLNDGCSLMELGVPGRLGLNGTPPLRTDNLFWPPQLSLSAKLTNARLSTLPFFVIGKSSMARYWLGTA
jgi:hypothetical protein